VNAAMAGKAPSRQVMGDIAAQVTRVILRIFMMILRMISPICSTVSSYQIHQFTGQ